MLESYLLKGLLIGLVFGVPAGAIGALTIQRALSHGFQAGFLTGLGSSAADMLYACVGICGLTMVSDFLLARQSAIRLAGGALILAMGLLTFHKKEHKEASTEQRVSLAACFGSAFAVAITNPATILSFFLAFTSFGIAQAHTPLQSAQLILGILLGTGCWWGLLAGVAAKFRDRVTARIYRNLNQLLGVLLMLFGLWTAFEGLTLPFNTH